MVDLAQLRRVNESFMPSVCAIKRNTATTRDAYGDPVSTWTTVAENVPCRVSRSDLGSEQVTGFRTLGDVATHAASLPADTDVRAGDRLVFNGITYDVTGQPIETSYLTAKRVGLVLGRP
jgi:hypothetical protein